MDKITIEDVRAFVEENAGEHILVFESPDYASAFVGITTDGNAVYDYDLMVKCLMEEDGMEELEAIEFIDYNTIRALPYFQYAPIVIHSRKEE